MFSTSDAMRFWAKVRKSADPEGCWDWSAQRSTWGYGRFHAGGKDHYAHRVAFVISGGVLGTDSVLHHLCENPICVRPDHLQLTTAEEHAVVLTPANFPAIKAAQTHCSNGHPFDAANTYIRPNGTRDCRPCNCLRAARYKARKKAGVA